MRRPLSIALIALIVFNTIGYYGFLLGLQYHNERKLLESFDSENGKVSETISIKIPIAIPYATDSKEYERVEGVFEHKGEFLRLVKQRLYRDTLEIVCIRDVKHKAINQAFVNFASSFADQPGDTPASKTIQFIKEYLSTTISISGAAEGWGMAIAVSQFEIALHPDYISSIIHPPERS